MRARTTTVLGFLLLLSAAPVQAAPAVPPPPAPMRVFVATTSIGSPTHVALSSRRNAPPRLAPASFVQSGRRHARPQPVADTESQTFLAAALSLFPPELLNTFGATPLVIAYVPAAGLGTLPQVSVGRGDALGWGPFGASPGRDLMDLMMARETVPALVPGEGGLLPADLTISDGDGLGDAGLFVSKLALRDRNPQSPAIGLVPPSLAVAGLAMICLAPSPRRFRPIARLQPMRRLRLHRRGCAPVA